MKLFSGRPEPWFAPLSMLAPPVHQANPTTPATFGISPVGLRWRSRLASESTGGHVR